MTGKDVSSVWNHLKFHSGSQVSRHWFPCRTLVCRFEFVHNFAIINHLVFRFVKPVFFEKSAPKLCDCAGAAAAVAECGAHLDSCQR